GAGIDQQVLRKWFYDASSEFFAEFGEVISRSLLHESVSMPDRSSLENILNKTITDNNLEGHKILLINGFHSFLNDVDPNTESQKLSFALATLSARLIAAATGPDPLSLNEFKNSKLFLDTNVLLLENIEMRNKEMSAALTALANSLNTIGATLHIIRATKDEYENVVARKRTQTLKAIRAGVSLTILEKSKDPFVQMGLKNMAKNEEDFSNFFNSITHPPTYIGSVPITLVESTELEAEITKAIKDTAKKSQISAEWEKLRGSKKNPILVEHDLSLNASCLFFRKEDGKGWVVTRDRSMLNLSKKWHERDGLPAWVYLEALVQILAVYGAGPDYQPEEFAPLLGALIRADVQATFSDFQVEDLGELADIDSRVFELSDEEVVSYAQKVHQLKLSGEESHSPDMQLHIRRTFQGRRISDNKNAENVRSEVRDKEKRIDLAKQIGISALSTQLFPKIRWELRRRKFFPYIIIAIALGIWIYFKRDNETWFVGLIIALVLDVGAPILTSSFSDDFKKENLKEKADERAKTLWESQNNQK
ncbi:MAG TPA: hypothetical protein VGC58_01600, partial [Candidatus Paceibacterota bacterium]